MPQVRDCASGILEAVPYTIGFIRQHMRKHRKGLSVMQFRSLVWVERNPNNTLSALAEFLGASLPTTSRIVAGLVANGYLTRVGRADDRRQVALGITESGRAVLHVAWSETREEVARHLGGLSDDEQAKIAEAMQLLMSVFGSKGSAHSPAGQAKD